MTSPVLDVKSLVVEIPTRHAMLHPVDGVSLAVEPGEIVGIVGESGAGKSMFGNAIIGLLNPPARISSGEIWLTGSRIDNVSADAMRRIRGKHIGMVFQDPLTSLNPLIPIGEQIIETIVEHLPVSKADARERAITLLEDVGIPGAASRLDAYAHQFSGGMRQRVVIALALCAEPALVIADEPTTALDVSVQAQIIALLKRLCRDRGTSVMLITHDMGVIAETTDRVAVMYAGRIVEFAGVRDVLTEPRHPYTQGLMASTPVATMARSRLVQIPGAMPRLDNLPMGCTFHPRCPQVQDVCQREPAPDLSAASGRAACWFAEVPPE